MEDQVEKRFKEAADLYFKKLKESGKPFCIECFDDRNVKKIKGIWYCDDCLYMKRLLNEIKKI